ncbi:hypothetical protein [Qipengyuania sp. MTN3-11]|uniref:hypothetical protein n=1 Tax=Qipengyuania sp. MTN3-11 TaxID=3056557 RepID=UPI0036F3A418
MAEMAGARASSDFAASMEEQPSGLPLSTEPRRGMQLADRLSVDSWLFIREGGASGAAVGTGAPFASYGRSQAGAILRYRLAPDSRLEPAAYLRADGALAGEGERQGAVGLSFRPVAAWPLRAHAEARATRQGGRTDVRPAAFVTAGTDAVVLPAGFAARAYAQAGYIGGRFSSAFADGRIVADREITRFDLGALRLGGGIWGGAQRGAQRLDAGPSATLSVGMGALPANISLDYRVRLAGDAVPGSGAALTLSRSF